MKIVNNLKIFNALIDPINIKVGIFLKSFRKQIDIEKILPIIPSE